MKNNRDTVLKALGDWDDAMVQLSDGSEWLIYNPESNNDENAHMWFKYCVFVINKDGEETEVEYSDITRISVNGTRFYE
jgi:hypothetical protein|tara:strand:- start:264 stop:500 length:237 start_codon:yes stop_codon:yes gene_type:complete